MTQVPTGRLVLDAAGDLYGLTALSPYNTTAAAPLGELWELPAGSATVTVLNRFTTAAPASLTADAAGDLFGVTDTPDGYSGAVFEYPADHSGLTTIPLGGQTDVGYHLAADAAGNVFGERRAASHSGYTSYDLYEIAHGAATPTTLTTVTTA